MQDLQTGYDLSIVNWTVKLKKQNFKNLLTSLGWGGVGWGERGGRGGGGGNFFFFFFFMVDGVVIFFY